MTERRGVSRVASSLLRARRPFRAGWTRGGAFVYCADGLTALLRACYSCAMENVCPCPLGALLFGGRGPLYSWFAFFADIVLW